MKFNEYVYQRPDFASVSANMSSLFKELASAFDARRQIELIREINVIRNHITTMGTLSSIRHSIDTTDVFYEAENDYWDNQQPLYEELNVRLYKILLESPFLHELKQTLPEPFFKIAEYALKSFDPSVIEEMQEENRLSSQYGKLLASAQIEFVGKVYTLPQLTPLTLSVDRVLRKRAIDAKTGFLQQHETEIDEIYDQLVKLRTQIAVKLGYPSYTELGYIRMQRLDYDASMVANYRKQILEEIVPVASKLYARQAKRLGLDKLSYFDTKFEFFDGNATPIGTPDEIVQAGVEMYHELSPETGTFIDFMTSRELLDLVAKKGKEGGGYCTFIPEYQSPFIFSNFNGTAGDVDVLTHEAGHAFQSFQSRWIDIPECAWPTLESCEIHSMSMEFIAWPWMEKFFGEAAQKYRFSHLGDAIKFLPYGVLVDHFQHEVYARPEMTPQQRKKTWRKLEKMYLPHQDYAGNAFLDNGAYWFQQGHIFSSPFYYIDYTLAQICALQFWKRTQVDDPEMWNDYLNLCSLGGTKSFVSLVKEANLISPFDDGCVKSVIKEIDTWLSAIDDTRL
ncbi:MAG: M3 family oligoendopeptidase [Erysipelotrichales bacterium]|nr:MAG: M3 family oligoendopeptidase [Erysipelotrichales bacterium]